MSLVVCGIQPSINAAYTKNAVPINVSLKALYRKIERIENAGRVRLGPATAERLAPVITAMGGGLTPFLPAIAPRSSMAITCPGPSTASRNCGRCEPGPCPAMPWSSSTPN